MINRLIISAIVGFIMRQYAKFQKGLDWSKIKADWEPRIRKAVPGEWLDNEVVGIAMAFLDACASVMAATAEIEKVLKLLAEQKWDAAWQVIRDLLLSQWKPVTPAEVKAYAAVKELEHIV